MSIKLTNEIIDERLKGKNITRVGNYINATTKLEWECDTCKHHWFAIPNTVSRGVSGCPSCNGGIKLSSRYVDEQIKDRNITRLDDYVDSVTLIKWKCISCEHEWKASPNNVINANTGCPICSQKLAGKKKTLFSKPKILNILKQKKISLTSPYTRVVDIHSFKCNTCGYEWSAILSSVINNPGKNCRSCSGIPLLTNEQVDLRLQERKDVIYRMSDVINATTKIKWRCEFGHEWEAVPDSVLNAGTGCSICNNRGTYSEKVFNRNPLLGKKHAKLYFLRFRDKNNPTKSFLKIGITTRLIKKRFAGKHKIYEISELKTISESLQYCWEKETHVLKVMDKHKYPNITKSFGGYTECFVDTPEVEQQILDLLNN